MRTVTTPQYYLAYQLVIRSSMPIPGAISLDGARSRIAPDVDIDVLEGSVAADDLALEAGPYRYIANKLIFEAPNVARYLCTESRITIEPANGVDDALVAGHLVATALPASLWMRGDILLHAAAVMLPFADNALAIAGVSGSGKSTVLGELVCTGARVLADDSVCIRMTAAGFIVSGLAAGYFLGRGPRIFHGLPPDRQAAAAPLAGLVILEVPRSDSVARFRQLDGALALEALLNNRHRPRVPALLGATSALGTLATISRRLPVRAWQRREGAIALDPVELEFLARR
jgi:hypothetical protein